ncbi:MAG TPA: acyl-CoA thioesterase domain-containing protein [Pseudonocardiaceae bacterium]|nr:acyl-CoA thioesterase domain-containing protein [Pseudonocardiaceae bacterium]
MPTVPESSDGALGAVNSAVADLLALTEVDEDTFDGWCHDGRPGWIYGGHVAAQALAAAGATVAAQRVAHSLHGYFIRPGRAEEPVRYQVDRTRDGRSFSTRQVNAIQRGKVIFALLASFHVPEDGFSHQLAEVSLPPVPEPDGELVALLRNSEMERLMDIRPVDRDAPNGRQRFWMRIREPLGDDPLTHAAALTYLSDSYLALSTILPHRRPGQLPVTSLDHALWLHRPFRADDWLLVDQRGSIAAGARGLATGEFFTADGVLVATVGQEALIRDPR